MSDVKDLPNSWPVLEIFGPTIQGEGALAGQKSHFIRLAICNDRCSWCDTKYSWNRKEATDMSLEEIVDKVRDLGAIGAASWITISGGNPGIWPNLPVIITALKSMFLEVNVETQGTVYQPWMSWRANWEAPNMLTVSPKPPSSGVRFRASVFERILRGSDNGDSGFQTVIKVVIFNEADYQWFKDYIYRQYASELPLPIYLQSGTPQEDIEILGKAGQQLRVCGSYAWLCDRVLKDPDMQDIVVLPQLHVLSFGHVRST